MITIVVQHTPDKVAAILAADARRALPELAECKASVKFDRRKGATITFTKDQTDGPDDAPSHTADDPGAAGAAGADAGAAGGAVVH